MATTDTPPITMEAARVNAKLSQIDMAKAMKMSLKTYNDYETGKRVLRVDKAWRFSEITGYPFSSIIFFKPNYTSGVLETKQPT